MNYTSTTPKVLPANIDPLEHTRIVTVDCPYCPQQHQHDWPYIDGVAPPGIHASDCRPGGQYFIAAPDLVPGEDE